MNSPDSFNELEKLISLAVCRSREEAASYPGVSRRWLQYKIKEYGLSKRCAKSS